jgi:hypothetical protein
MFQVTNFKKFITILRLLDQFCAVCSGNKNGTPITSYTQTQFKAKLRTVIELSCATQSQQLQRRQASGMCVTDTTDS